MAPVPDQVAGRFRLLRQDGSVQRSAAIRGVLGLQILTFSP